MKKYLKWVALLSMLALFSISRIDVYAEEADAAGQETLEGNITERKDAVALKKGKAKKGTFKAGVNDIWYQLTIKKGGYLDISFEAGNMQADVTLLLYREEESGFDSYTLLKRSSSISSMSGRLAPVSWFEAGIYYIRIKASDVPEEITFTIKYNHEPLEFQDQEPNEPIRNAQALKEGETVTGRVWSTSKGQDVIDIYAVELPKAEHIYVKLTSLSKAGVAKIYLKNADSEILNDDKYQVLASEGKKESLTFTAGILEAGTYYLYVMLNEGSEFPYSITAKGYTELTDIKVSKKLNLTVGKTQVLKYTATPGNATESVSYTSSNKKVATVDSKGKITAKAAGTAKITVKGKCSRKKAICTVTVSEAKVSSVKLTAKKKTIYVDDTLALSAQVSPKNAANKKLAWSSGDKTIATVSASGKVTAKKAGSVTITAKAKDGSGKKASIKIKVLERPTYKVTLNWYNLSLKVGEQGTLKAETDSSDGKNTKITWSSSNPYVAAVTNGRVTAVGSGSATITATNGVSEASCRVTVTAPQPVETPKEDPKQEPEKEQEKIKVTLSGGSSVKKNGTLTLTAQGGTGGTWSSSDTSVAMVQGSGNTAVVTGVKAGTATITYEEQGQKFTKSIFVKDY